MGAGCIGPSAGYISEGGFKGGLCIQHCCHHTSWGNRFVHASIHWSGAEGKLGRQGQRGAGPACVGVSYVAATSAAALGCSGRRVWHAGESLLGGGRLEGAWLSGWPLSRGEPLEPDPQAMAAAADMPLAHQGLPLRQSSSALQQQRVERGGGVGWYGAQKGMSCMQAQDRSQTSQPPHALQAGSSCRQARLPYARPEVCTHAPPGSAWRQHTCEDSRASKTTCNSGPPDAPHRHPHSPATAAG